MASLSAPITALRQRFSGRKRSGLAGELDPSDPQVQLQQLAACYDRGSGAPQSGTE